MAYGFNYIPARSDGTMGESNRVVQESTGEREFDNWHREVFGIESAAEEFEQVMAELEIEASISDVIGCDCGCNG